MILANIKKAVNTHTMQIILKIGKKYQTSLMRKKYDPYTQTKVKKTL